MGRIIATTSGKGGVGKSTVAAGLGFAFALKGEKVLIVDMDEGLRCLDLILGVDDSAVLDLSDALNGADIEDVAYSCRHKNLFLVPAPANVGEIDPDKFEKFVRQVKSLYDIVIFDFPAGLDFTLYTKLPKTAVFMTVAVPDNVSVRDAAAVSFKLHNLGLSSRLIINRYRFKFMKKSKRKNIDGIIDSAGLRLLGIVPERQELNSLSLTHNIRKRGPAMKAFTRIANRLLEEDVPLPNPKKI